MRDLVTENYLKCIYSLSQEKEGGVSTTEIAEKLSTKPPSVSEMLKKLKSRGLVHYKKYYGTSLSEEGKAIAIRTIRKHRLWEVFLLEKLDFAWDEVHEIAEQLEHIDSPILTKRLDAFLGFPKFDPHGDPIPDSEGNISAREATMPLSEAPTGSANFAMVGVGDSSSAFLKYLDKLGLGLGVQLCCVEKIEFDSSVVVEVDDRKISISKLAADNILIKKVA